MEIRNAIQKPKQRDTHRKKTKRKTSERSWFSLKFEISPVRQYQLTCLWTQKNLIEVRKPINWWTEKYSIDVTSKCVIYLLFSDFSVQRNVTFTWERRIRNLKAPQFQTSKNFFRLCWWVLLYHGVTSCSITTKTNLGTVNAFYIFALKCFLISCTIFVRKKMQKKNGKISLCTTGETTKNQQIHLFEIEKYINLYVLLVNPIFYSN